MNEFTKELVKTMTKYKDGIEDQIAAALTDVSKEALREVKSTSPKRTGRYAKGWKIDKTRTSCKFSFVIYNKDHYRLTHLLENGHKTRLKSGKYGSKSKSKAMPHIAIAAEKAEKDALRAIEKAVKG